jgi:ABC-type Zn uptake system ZnuABC Zn-binding protein ZnuA
MKAKTYTNRLPIILAIVALLAFAATGCQPKATPLEREHGSHEVPKLLPVTLGEGEKLQVVATTNIVGDVVSIVGSDRIALTTLMGVGVDPHSYVPTPADTAAVHDAHAVFANGAGLEEFLAEMLDSAGGDAVEIHLSDGLELRGTETEDEHEEVDPHVWFDVQNVIQWVETTEQALAALDPANAEVYRASAEAYVHQLEELDAWVVEQVATIPQANRKLVTNHPAFGYFADRYGVEQIGAVYPVSPSSEPSARDITELEKAIREYGAPAVFTESTVNPKLAEQVAGDTGVKLVPLYTGSLGGPGSGVESYAELMRYDVTAIVEALR